MARRRSEETADSRVATPARPLTPLSLGGRSIRGQAHVQDLSPKAVEEMEDQVREEERKAKTKQSVGRPSKLETRAWELFSRSATVAMTREHRRDKFREACFLAEEFDEFWRERK